MLSGYLFMVTSSMHIAKLFQKEVLLRIGKIVPHLFSVVCITGLQEIKSEGHLKWFIDLPLK
jgi:hypothetical protein